MAVIQVWRIAEGRSGEFDQKAGRRYQRVFGVRTNNAEDGEGTVLAASGIPALFDVFSSGNETDLGSRCVRLSAEQDGNNPFVWRVTADYDAITSDPNRNEQDPLDRRTTIAFSTNKYRVPVLREPGNGKRIRNSAGEPFDPPVEADESRPVVTFDRYEVSIEPAFLFSYQDALNSDVFFGGQPGQWKITDISAQEVWENDQPLFKVRYQMEGKREGWQPLVVDQGMRYLSGGPGELAPFMEPGNEGRLATSPQLLDGQGGPLEFANSTLELDIDAVYPHLSLASIAPFPDPEDGAFVVAVEDELMLVTAEDADPADTWTVVRGYAGTTAAAHLTGETCQMQMHLLRFKVYKELPFSALNLP